jgi:hypothetical protein
MNLRAITSHIVHCVLITLVSATANADGYRFLNVLEVDSIAPSGTFHFLTARKKYIRDAACSAPNSTLTIATPATSPTHRLASG